MIIMWGIGRQRTVNRLGNLLPQDDQESLVVRDKVGRDPQASLGCASSRKVILYAFSALTLLVGQQEGHVSK